MKEEAPLARTELSDASPFPGCSSSRLRVTASLAGGVERRGTLVLGVFIARKSGRIVSNSREAIEAPGTSGVCVNVCLSAVRSKPRLALEGSLAGWVT